MKPDIFKIYRILITLFIVAFSIAYLICGFFDNIGRDIVAHITGTITMCGCLIVSVWLFRFEKEYLMLRLFGTVSNFGMFIAYFLYIFKAISPSNLEIISHAAISMFFDVFTLMQAITNLISLSHRNKEISHD